METLASPSNHNPPADHKPAADHKACFNYNPSFGTIADLTRNPLQAPAHTENRPLPSPHSTPAPAAAPTSPKAAPASPKPASAAPAVVVPVVAPLVVAESAPVVVTPAPSIAQNVSLSLEVTEEVQEVSLKK